MAKGHESTTGGRRAEARSVLHAACRLALLAAAIGASLGCKEAAAAGAGVDPAVAAAPLEAAPTAEATPVDRLRRWDRAQRLLDRGENRRAATAFADALGRDPTDILTAEGLYQAAFRLCRLDSVLDATAALATTDGADPLRPYMDAEGSRSKWRYAEAAAGYRRSATLAAVRGDSLSVAMALLQAARCLSRESRYEAAGRLAARGRAAAWAAAAGARATGAARLEEAYAVFSADLAHFGGRFAAADSLYRSILAPARAAGRRQIECDCLNGLGRTVSRRRLPAQAVALSQEAVAVAERMADPFRLAQALTNLAYDEGLLRRADHARAHLERARALAESCGLGGLLGFIHGGLGSLAEAAGDRVAAVAGFRKALSFHERAGSAAGALGSRQRLAYSLLMMGEYREAISHYDQCLALSDSLDSPVGANWVLGGLALAWHKLGRLDRAEEYYRRSLVVDERLGDRASAAWCLNSLGLLHAVSGDYRQALLQHHKALAISEEIGDAEGSGNAHVSIAEVHTRLGDYELAFKHGVQAFEIAQRAQLEELLRASASALAAACAATGRADPAERYLRQALEIAGRWRDREAQLWALDDLAEQCLARGRSGEARSFLEQAASLLAESGQFDLRARTLLLRARCNESPAEAVALSERALAAARAGSLPEREWQCLSDLGLGALALGDSARALACQMEALDVVESLRRQVGVDELRRHMLRPALTPYERAIDLLLSGSPDERSIGAALTCAERSRARILAERLLGAAGSAADTTRAVEAAAAEDLLARIGYLQARLQESGLDGDERIRLRARIDTLEQRHVLVALAENRAEPRPADLRLEELLAALRPGERALSYFLGSQRSWVISIARGRLSARALPPRAQIEHKVRVFLQLWRQAGEASALPPSVLAAARREMYELLIGPVAGEITRGETLVILPDGVMHRLPFAQLRSERGFLLEEHELFVAPSLQTLRYLRLREAARRDAERPALDVLALGCGGTGADGSARMLPFTDAPVIHLPHAEEEARRVAALFPASLVLAGTAADERSFNSSALDRCAILHVAAHGQVDDTDVRRSFIVLNSAAARPIDPEAGAEDDLLQWHEASRLPLRASLVTLAACRSAGGVLAVGEGVTGLTQAFLHAGASCVLAAQSDVPDRLSGRLMDEFYRGLRRGLPASAALRSAQLAALERAGAGGACAWAGFMLVGDGRVAVPVAGRGRLDARTVLDLAAVGAAVLAILCVILRHRESKT